jgi:hypothetical protein
MRAGESEKILAQLIYIDTDFFHQITRRNPEDARKERPKKSHPKAQEGYQFR